MALKITKASDPITVEHLTVTIYGQPGIGKSTLGFTAEKPLLLDFDRGAYRAGNRGDVVQIETWRDVESISASDLAGYSTLIIDTAGRALDSLAIDITSGDPKKGNGASLNLQGFGVLKGRYLGWSKLVRSFGVDVVLIAHTDEQRKGDDLIVRLDAQGSSKGEIYKTSDLMGQLYLSGNRRMLNFSPTDTAFGKNPAQFTPFEVPDFRNNGQFLAEVIALTKGALNRQTEEQKRVAGLLAEYKEIVDNAKTPEDLGVLIEVGQKAEDEIKAPLKALIAERAKALGYRFHKGQVVPLAA